MNDLTKVSKNVKIWGWAVLVAGLFALLSPLIAGAFVTVTVGAVMFVAGVTRIVDAFQGGGQSRCVPLRDGVLCCLAV